MLGLRDCVDDFFKSDCFHFIRANRKSENIENVNLLNLCIEMFNANFHVAFTRSSVRVFEEKEVAEGLH